MKVFLSLFILIVSLTVFGQTKLDNWYKVEIDEYQGYFNYSVEENPNSILTSFVFKLKIDENLLYYKAKLTNEKDSFLTVKSFDLEGTTDNLRNPEIYTIAGTVTSADEYLYWKAPAINYSKTTKQPTIVDWNLFHVMTTLDYSKKGIILEFNSMEISELNYKENHTLEYVSDEIIEIEGKKVKARKITHTGDRIGESTYWVDFDNNLVKISIDNSKNFIKCKKEAINLEEYK